MGFLRQIWAEGLFYSGMNYFLIKIIMRSIWWKTCWGYSRIFWNTDFAGYWWKSWTSWNEGQVMVKLLNWDLIRKKNFHLLKESFLNLQDYAESLSYKLSVTWNVHVLLCHVLPFCLSADSGLAHLFSKTGRNSCQIQTYLAALQSYSWQSQSWGKTMQCC